MLFIVNQKGLTITTLEVDFSDTITIVKQKVKEKTGIPPDSQIILYKGKPLEDEQTLSYYKIHNECTLRLLIRGHEPSGLFICLCIFIILIYMILIDLYLDLNLDIESGGFLYWLTVIYFGIHRLSYQPGLFEDFSIVSWNWRSFNNKKESGRSAYFLNEMLPWLNEPDIIALQEHKDKNPDYFDPFGYIVEKTKIFKKNSEGYVNLTSPRCKNEKSFEQEIVVGDNTYRPVWWTIYLVDEEFRIAIGNFHAPFPKGEASYKDRIIRECFKSIQDGMLDDIKKSDLIVLATDGNLGLLRGDLQTDPIMTRLVDKPTTIFGSHHDTIFLNTKKYLRENGILLPTSKDGISNEFYWKISNENHPILELTKNQKKWLNKNVSDHLPLVAKFDLFGPLLRDALNPSSPIFLKFRLPWIW